MLVWKEAPSACMYVYYYVMYVQSRENEYVINNDNPENKVKIPVSLPCRYGTISTVYIVYASHAYILRQNRPRQSRSAETIDEGLCAC